MPVCDGLRPFLFGRKDFGMKAPARFLACAAMTAALVGWWSRPRGRPRSIRWRILQGAQHPGAGRVRPGWRLRPLCAHACPLYGPSHPRQSDHGAAEHAGRRRRQGDELSLQRRAQGRHGHRHFSRAASSSSRCSDMRKARNSTRPNIIGSAASRMRSRSARFGRPAG